MSRLNDPPLRTAVDSMPADEKVPATGFKWPTPPYAAYPPPSGEPDADRCEMRLAGGKRIPARLIFFVPEEAMAHVQMPPARTTTPIRFSQLRSLTLQQPLKPYSPAGHPSPAGAALLRKPRTHYRLDWAAGGSTEGETIGFVEHDFGVFLFVPLDASDAVQRVFVPRSAYRSFELSPRIGEVLVESRVVTPEQVEQAAAEQQRLRSRRLGETLVTAQAVTPAQLLLAIERQGSMPMVLIGDALLSLGLITKEQLDTALETQKSDRATPLGQMMVRMGMVSREDLQTALARKMGYPLVDVRQFPIDVEALKRVPAPVAARLSALPVMMHGASLVVAVIDPTRRNDLEELEFIAQCKVVPVLAQHADIATALPVAYEKIGAALDERMRQEIAAEAIDAGKLVESLERELAGGAQQEEARQIEQSDNSLVRLINQMIIEAHTQGVSDIHVESQPGRQKVKIRFRKDGVLHPYIELPHTYRNAVVARIKIMCDLDISERRKPQDGKIAFARFSPHHRLELRVATIPTNSGLEDVVMRLLASAKPMPLDGLGMSPRNVEALKFAVERPYGMVLCVGPTGSGKTTTLHSALSYINVPERKIWTAEDPVEITQPGLRQVQVNPRIDWTFAKALRAFLRADPDVIMVGEVRDAETAQVAIEASLTGHLVLSTLHTNSAPETVTRLLDMGMDPFNFADSLLAVLAQRLVRRLCTACRVSRPASDGEADELLADWLRVMPEGDARPDPASLKAEWIRLYGRDGSVLMHECPGCPRCSQTGYRGRASIHELMTVSRGMRRLIQNRARSEELQDLALREGMRTLRQDGIEKVLAGITSIEEVRATSNL